METLENISKHMKTHGNTWKYMQTHENTWKQIARPMRIHNLISSKLSMTLIYGTGDLKGDATLCLSEARLTEARAYALVPQ